MAPSSGAHRSALDADRLRDAPRLELVRQARVHELLFGFDASDDFEPSGVVASPLGLVVVFDDRKAVGVFRPELRANDPANRLVGSGDDSDYEAITYDSHGTPNYYVIQESEKYDGDHYPVLHELDVDLKPERSTRLDVKVDSRNKGLEGLAWVRRDDDDFLLGLMEKDGDIVVFQEKGDDWKAVARMAVPVDGRRGDFADLAIDAGGRVAVALQESSALWVGQLAADAWEFDGPGEVYAFPRGDDDGNLGAGDEIVYQNVEGVTWLDASTVACVSDRAKKDQSDRTRTVDASIHVFSLPR